MRIVHTRLGRGFRSSYLYVLFAANIFGFPFFVELASSAAPTVGVGAGVNCPGSYVPAGTGKVCQASMEYKDLIYLGENSRATCKYPYTRVNAGESKWCVTYPDP